MLSDPHCQVGCSAMETLPMTRIVLLNHRDKCRVDWDLSALVHKPDGKRVYKFVIWYLSRLVGVNCDEADHDRPSGRWFWTAAA
jgi:hypothetical protein